MDDETGILWGVIKMAVTDIKIMEEFMREKIMANSDKIMNTPDKEEQQKIGDEQEIMIGIWDVLCDML